MFRVCFCWCVLLVSACATERFPVELTLEVEADGQLQRITRNTECVATGVFSKLWKQHSRIVHPLPEGGYLLLGIGETYCLGLHNRDEIFLTGASSFMDLGWTDDFRNPNLVAHVSTAFESAESPPRVKPSTLVFMARRLEKSKPPSKELAADSLVRWFGISSAKGGPDNRAERILQGGVATILPRAQWEKVGGARELFLTFHSLATVSRADPVFRGLSGLEQQAVRERLQGAVENWDDVQRFALYQIGESNWEIDRKQPGVGVYQYAGAIQRLPPTQSPAFYEGIDITRSNVLYDPRSDEVIVVIQGLIGARGE